MRASDRLGLAVMAAMALGLTSLQVISADGRLVTGCLLMIAVVGIAGIVTRRMLPTDRGARLIQGVLSFISLVVMLMSDGVSNPFALPTVFDEAARWTAESSAPMNPNVAVRVIAVSTVTLLAFMADQLSVSFARPAWSLLPIGLLYLVPALTLPTLVTFWQVLWLGVGYLLVLLADAANRGQMLRFQAADGPRWSLLLGGLVSLLAALLVAGLAGVFTPGLDNDPGAPFSNQGSVQMGDPSLDLRRNLQQPVDRRVISYTSSRPNGSYLRMTTLPAFDEGGFHLTGIDLFTGSLPSAEGVPAGRPRFTVDVAVADFNAEWLPLPYAPAAFQASGDWRYDPVSLSVLASGPQQKRATNGLHYQATAVDVNPTAEELAKAIGGRPRDAVTTVGLPANFPQPVVSLARRVTQKGASDGEKAVLLQNWLRSPAFTYSTDPAPGSGYTALTQFLLVDKTGYCEQFAASMAVMARAIGIPSRVAIGFLPGRRVGDHWEINIREMHAWPELYFAGLGWVSFEPTPGVAVAPGYTGEQARQPSASPSATATPSSNSASEKPSAAPSVGRDDQPSETAGPADQSFLGWAGGALLVLALAAVPALVRRGRRLRRLRADVPREAVTGAWDELRDTVWDAGGEWPSGSARQIGGAVAKDLPTEAAAAMGRVAVLVEQSRYAEHLGATGALGDDVERVRAGIAVDGRHTWWRRLFPRSLWRGMRWRG